MREVKSYTAEATDARWIAGVVDRYQILRTEREGRVQAFCEGRRPYFICQTPPGDVWLDAQTPEQSFAANIRYVADSLEIPSDHLPVLEPWFGTGLFANMYGCPYVWRTGEAPAVHCRYQTVEALHGRPRPAWEKSEVARLVLDTIRHFKTRTGSAIPIVWTDTQSAHDTATLVLDAAAVFAGCLTEPDIMWEFMSEINRLTIEFSQVQAELIGEALARPGHLMFTSAGLHGISVSDDNIAVGSPYINERFNLPLDEEIGRALGGVAIHSCGKWSHSMGLLRRLVTSCTQIECAVDRTVDPTPNEPEAVRDAMAGSGLLVKVRLTGETEPMLATVRRLLHPDLRLCIQPAFVDRDTAERNYALLEDLLGGFYSDHALPDKQMEG